jgi:hypothetical protein
MEKIVAVHLPDPVWREVIPLAAVLAGRGADSLLKVVVTSANILRISPFTDHAMASHPSELLLKCLADEPQLSLKVVDDAVEAISRLYPELATLRDWRDVLSSEYGERLWVVARALHATATSDIGSIARTVDRMVMVDRSGGATEHEPDLTAESVSVSLANARERMSSSDSFLKVQGAIIAKDAARRLHEEVRSPRPAIVLTVDVLAELRSCSEALVSIMRSEQDVSRYVACWALGWIGALQSIDPDELRDVISVAFDLWKSAGDEKLRDRAAWCLWRAPIAERESRVLGPPDPKHLEFIQTELRLDVAGYEDRTRAAVVAAYYLGGPWDDGQLREHVRSAFAGELQKKELFVALLAGS